MSSEGLTTSQRRRRPTFACEPCRRKKIRCNRKVPCDQCIRSKSEYCNYLQNGAGRPDSSRYTTQKPVAARQIHSSHCHQQPVSTIGRDRRTSETQLASPASFQSTDSNDGEEFHEGSLNEYSHSSGASSSSLPARGVFVASQFFGPSHWMNSISQFQQVYDLQRRYASGPETSLYGKCKQLAGKILTQQSTPHPLASHLRNLLPPKEVTDQLVQAYLRTFESVLRVLHVPSFLSECHGFWQCPDHATPEFVLQLLMVSAIGAGFSPKLIGDYNPSTWIHAAETGLRSINEDKRASVIGVQILCLILLARQIIPDPTEKNLSWITAEGLLRAAMQIGLHIGPSRLPPMSFYDEQMRIRLWASVLEIYLQHCLEVGGSPTILAHELDLELPYNIADEHFDQRTAVAPAPEPIDQFTHTSIQITLIQSFAVRLEIAAFLNNPKREGLYRETLQLASRLSSFCKSKYQRFQRDKKPQAHRFSMRLLDLFMHRFLLALHAPFAFRAAADPTLCFSRKASLQVALTLLDRSLCTEDDEYARAILVGVGFFAGPIIQAASIICAELLSQMEEEMSMFTPSPGSAGRQILCKVLEDYTSLLKRRVMQADPDIQILMLFLGLTAQIEALQSERSVQDAIEEALQQGLSECHKLLEDRARQSQIVEPTMDSTDTLAIDDFSWTASELQDWMSCGGINDPLLMPPYH